MDATAFRALQAPLKQRYREQPGAAVITVSAEGRFDRDGVTCTVDGWAGPVVAGLHPAGGGSGAEACSGDMLLEALVACAGVTLRSVATAMGIELKHARIRAEGKGDVRGTLGVDRTVPVGLTEIALSFELDADAERASLDKLVELTERYCVIFQTLQQPPKMSLSLQTP